MIYTFYSYKGGVGRSMALANVAEWLYRQGLRVVIIDWDLEAPGLESYFYQSPEELENVRSQLGLIDMLTAYRRMFPRLPLARTQSASAIGIITGDANSSETDKTLEVLEQHLPPIAPMLYPIHAPETSSSGNQSPALWLLPAGCRAGERFNTYAQSVQDFNWSDFYLSYEGEAYFEWLRRQLTSDDLADVVLIDSRTGVTEMGGVCTRQLADVVVSFCVPNLQNLNGVELMARSFRRPEVIAKRGRQIEVVMVPTRIDVSELDARNNFEREFRTRLDQFTPPAFGTVQSEFWNLKINYIPKYAYSEKLAINAPDTASELEDSYKKIAAHLVLLAAGESGVRIRRKYATELQRVFKMLPSLVISYADEQGKSIASDLRKMLPDFGVSAWPELPNIQSPQEEWRQITGLLDQSRCLVLVITPGTKTSEKLMRQWRYARQQGIATLLVSQGVELNESEKQWCPLWVRDAHCYDLTRDWEALVRLLQSPPPTARVPFMAPDLPSNYVSRPEEIRRLKGAFLLTEAPDAFRNVGLWGAAGSGKKVLAEAFCHDEEVMAQFCDGILWAALGTEPDVLGEITKLYYALTGERPVFVDEREAAQRLSERLSGKNCLLVIEDAWDLKTLKPLLDAAPRCHKLIITRDLNILTSINATAITPGDFKTDEAVALLTAQLNLTPDEALMFAPFTERLGQWPLALRLANAQLRKLMSQGIGAHEALEYMDQALNKLGVLAFDQPNVPDGDESVARSMALTLNHLSEEERECYAQIAFFPPEETITSAKLAARWRLDEFEAEKLLQRYAELALIRYDLSTKVVNLGSKLRDYILSPASGYNVNSRYDAAFDHLSSEEQAIAKRVLTRLVRLALPNERAGDTRLTAQLNEFDADENQVIPSLADGRLVEIDSNASGARTVQLAGEEVLRSWTRLQQWLQEDREFLLWRQSLRRQMAEWEEHRDRGALLSGVPLQIAATYLKLRGLDLNQAERNYIADSQAAELDVQTKLQTAEESKQIAAHSVQQLKQTRVLGAYIVAGLVLIGLVVLVVGSFLLYRTWQASQQLTQAINANTRGRTQADEGNLGAAITSYQEAIRLKPDYTEAYINLAKAWRDKGNADEAINAYSRAIELGLSDPAIFAARGDIFVAKNDFYHAIDDYSKAIDGSPDNASYYSARSSAYQALNRNDEAKRDFEKARELTAKPSPQVSVAPTATTIRVYLHYNDPEDRATIQRLAKQLRDKGYDVVRSELRPENTEGDVRYFNERDRAAAIELRALVKSLLGEKSPSDIQLIASRSQKYVVPYGQLEVWLPSLSYRATSNYEQKTEAIQQKMKPTPSPERQEVQQKMVQKKY